MTGIDAVKHHIGNDSSLKRKFRIWRCDIPRDNCKVLTQPIQPEDTSAPDYNEQMQTYNKNKAEWDTYEKDNREKGISRYYRKPMDRMRNPWLYLKLENSTNVNKRTEIHDILMKYFE